MNPSPQQSPSVVTAVIYGLIALTLVAIAGTIFLIWDNVDPGQVAVVSGFAGTGLGALAAVLVSTRSVDPAVQVAAVNATAANVVDPNVPTNPTV